MLNYTMREKVCDRERKGVCVCVCVCGVRLCVCVGRVYSFVQCTLLMVGGYRIFRSISGSFNQEIWSKFSYWGCDKRMCVCVCWE